MLVRGGRLLLSQSRHASTWASHPTRPLMRHVVETFSVKRPCPRAMAWAVCSPHVQKTLRYTSTGARKDQDIVEALATHSHGDPQGSTTRGLFTEIEPEPSQDIRPGAKETAKALKSGITSDLEAIRDTFALTSVPREAYVLGGAGLIPYFSTSMATVYCAWDVHYAQAHGQGFLLSGEHATWMLQYLEPLQIGYGAVIISFLGAIHWGLEWAKFNGTFGYPRYAIGVIAPAIAWPTVLLPYEYALIAQFLGFTYLYYADAKATTRGWAPHWYSTYRFVLTFLAGLAIVVSLVGKSLVRDVLERHAMGAGSLTDPKQKISLGMSEGDRRLAAYEAEKSQIIDKKEEEKRKKTEAEEKPSKAKAKTRGKSGDQTKDKHVDEDDEE